MTPTIIQVFYDSNAYPFKDKQLEVRFPIVGQAFAGASNTTTLRFYVGLIGGTSTTTWVVNAKLPNGKKLYKILDSSSDDDGEYVELSLDETFTQVKGDLYIALNGYQGGVRIEEDDDTHIYSVVGSPMIMATGVIKLSIVYAPVNDDIYIDETNEEITIQSLLGAITDRLETSSGIVVVSGISLEPASNFTNGQMVYDKSTDIFYQVVSGEYVKQQLVDIAYEYTQSGSGVILTIKLSDGLGVYKTLTINLTTYLASLTYVNAQLNTKVNRLSTSGPHAYTHNGSSQGEIEINVGAVGGSLPIRNANGQIIVPLTPTENNHATSKNYVDDNLNLKADKSTTYTKTEVNNLIDSVKSGEIVLVNTTTYPTLISFLNSTGVEGTIYLYPINTSDLNEGYYRYVWETISGTAQWVSLGTTEIDLSDYYTSDEVDTLLESYVAKTTTIAGIDLQDNITAQELTDSLVFANNTDIDNLFA